MNGSAFTIVLIAALAAVGLFVVGLSLSLLIRGRHFDGDISTNENMRKLGIKCPVREAREELQGEDCPDPEWCSGACSSCDIENSHTGNRH